MVFIVPAALSGAKIAQIEKARMISEEVTRTCQLTLEPLRSAIVGPSLSIFALVLGGCLSSRSTPTLLRWLPPSFPCPLVVWNVRAQGGLGHKTQPCIHTLFPLFSIELLLPVPKSNSPVN